MHVPETSMHKDNFAKLWKRKVRGARQVAPVQSKSVTEPMHERSHQFLGRRVLPANAGHDAAALAG